MRKHGPPESEHPVYSWHHQKIWMRDGAQCDWGKRTGDTPHSWGFWTQGQAGSLSLDHVQHEEAGLSPYPKKLLEQCSGSEGRMDSCFPFFPPKVLGFPETSAISITFSLNIQLRDWNMLSFINVDTWHWWRGKGSNQCVPCPAVPRICNQADNASEQWFLIFDVHQNYVEWLLDHRLLGATQSFWFNNSGWELRICIYKKYQGDVDAVGPEITLWVAGPQGMIRKKISIPKWPHGAEPL